MYRKEKEDPWEFIERDFDRIWTLCGWLKDQTSVKKISPDEFLAALSLMFRLLKRHIKALGLKGGYYRTVFTKATLRDNEAFAEAMLAILHPKEGEDLSKWLKDQL